MNTINMSLTKTPMAQETLAERLISFDEVALGYTPQQAMEEAARCLNCPAQYCVVACPVHNQIPQFMKKVAQGDFEGAYQTIVEVNPMPAVTGRVCAQERQCEGACTRGIKGEPVAIGRLERFVADWHRTHFKGAPAATAPAKGKKVAVVGSGPAGLTCASTLAHMGYGVTIFEGRSFAGGIPVYGIPQFILPNEIPAEEVDNIRKLGIKFAMNTPIYSAALLLEDGYDAVYLATGADQPVKLNVRGESLDNVYSATSYLSAVNVEKIYLGRTTPMAQHKHLVVVGGGNTAIDVCRSARRMGAKVTLVYRRTIAEMPARREEVVHAMEEGVEILELSAPTQLLGKIQVTGVECVKMELTTPDYPGGRPNVLPVPGSQTVLEADGVVLALGYGATSFPGVAKTELGHIQVGEDGASTSLPGVFAGGDAVSGAATLIQAMGAGKQGAAAIAAYLA